MTSSFFTDVIKTIDNEYASLADDGISAGDVSSFIDTGSYIFNGLLSGSIYGGLPSNKITALAGESSTGKTFFTLSIIKNFLETNKDAGVFYFESESAVSKQMFAERGIDTKRVMIIPVATVQQFRQQSLVVLDNYLKLDQKDRKPMMFVLDSLGMLSTTKEIEDSEAGKETRDMTRAQVVKAIFRVLTLKLGKADVPLIVTNHTYDVVGAYMPTKEMGGGSGLKYAASTIVYLSKAKEKDGTDVVGNLIRCETKKSRFTRENKKISTRLFYDERGLDKYYGMIELGLEHGVFEKTGNRIKVGESSVYPKAMLKEPEKYFTPEIMKALDDAAKKEFSYGS